MTIPTITASPVAPSRTTDTPDGFVTKSVAFVDWLTGLSTQLNNWSAQVVLTVAGTDFNGTSTTSLLIGTGSKVFTSQTGKLWQIGQFVIAASTVTPANYMYGQVTAYNSGTGALTVNVTVTGGSGTLAAWSIGLAPVLPSYATLAGAETLTNKTITFGTNTITMTVAQLNTAVTDGDVATLAGTETLTNKTLTDPIMGGTARQAVYAVTDAAGAVINPRNGSIQTWTLGASRTPTFTGWNDGDETTLMITGAGFSITWTGITHIGGTAPSLLASGVTTLRLWKAGGTMYLEPKYFAPTLSTEIAYVGGTTANGALSASALNPSVSLTALTGGLATAPAIGDMVIVAVCAAMTGSADMDLTMNTAGYTELTDLFADNAGNVDTNFAVYIKYLAAADTTVSPSIPAASTLGGYAIAVHVWRNTAATLDVTATTATNIASALADAPSATPVTSGVVAIVIGAAGYGGTAQTFSASALSNFIQAGGAGSSTKSLVGMGSFKNPAGAYDPAAFGLSGADSTGYSSAAATLILRRA